MKCDTDSTASACVDNQAKGDTTDSIQLLGSDLTMHMSNSGTSGGVTVAFTCSQDESDENKPFVLDMGNTTNLMRVVWPTSLACPIITEVSCMIPVNLTQDNVQFIDLSPLRSSLNWIPFETRDNISYELNVCRSLASTNLPCPMGVGFCALKREGSSLHAFATAEPVSPVYNSTTNKVS